MASQIPLHKRELKGKRTRHEFNSKGKPLIRDPDGGYMVQDDSSAAPKQRIAPRKERRRVERLNAKIAKERARINKPAQVSDEEFDE